MCSVRDENESTRLVGIEMEYPEMNDDVFLSVEDYQPWPHNRDFNTTTEPNHAIEPSDFVTISMSNALQPHVLKL